MQKDLKLEQDQEQGKISNKQPVSTVDFSKVQEQIDQELSNPNMLRRYSPRKSK